ncbi:MAG: glycosyltransferase family 4 protein [Bacteroidetes bacterium]|nr:glycosyltransferase family 4 protein [Bacteroidota bacterium]
MEKNLPKICFLADSHSLYDDRIYWKEACSLARAGFEVYYVLAAENNSSGKTVEGIHYQTVQCNLSANRYLNYVLKRISPKGLYRQLFRKAVSTKADVFHLHDLKILRLVGKLKALPNKPKVIYDVHEPYPENILDYNHGFGLPASLRAPYAGLVRKWERQKASKCDLIITTEENLQKRFQAYFPDKPVEVIYNYTDLVHHLSENKTEIKEFDAIYTGGITRLRGAFHILKAMMIVVQEIPQFRMLFLGSWFPEELKSEMAEFIAKQGLEANVKLKNAVPYPEVVDYYQKSRMGLGIFLPIPTHRIILQIKIFEYMKFGLPILGSNFGHISRIIDKHQCGMTVNPESPEEIAAGMIKLSKDEKFYKACSDNGRKAADKYYQWDHMEQKLIGIYDNLTS